ncbi:MAG: class I SAM-dependent methyltransferase [Gemmatimonadetes bacterium]|nr:class I SAM-dependent methyltransferase [Gemmatimonadota bacterium]MBT6623124.1 class I SAM-dependent methyltransferase [Gemmatimonadota bacterium]MBT7587228.1 class I SAM-dependent methyltransferase [Gemmatimonadota bacterium]
MQSLKVNYSGIFAGLTKKPNSYREISDNYEWAKRDVEQHIDQYYYDDFNQGYLKRELAGQEGKLVVECGCGLGGNLIPYARRHRCIGFDFSRVALGKLRRYDSEVFPALADISAIPLADGCADYVVLARVLFVHEDIDFIVAILREARRILKPCGKVLIVNDFSSVGVRVFNGMNDLFARLVSLLRPGRDGAEFMLYYFSHDDLCVLLERAGLRLLDDELCNIHQGVYHLTYHNKLFGLLLRDNFHHYRIRRKDHWERVRLSRGINDAYPLNWFGRVLVRLAGRYWPSLAALSLNCSASKNEIGDADSRSSVAAESSELAAVNVQ